MKASDYQKVHDEKRQEEMKNNPELRGYYKPAELAGKPIIITGIDQVGESKYQNEEGGHDPFLMATVQVQDGAEMKDAKLRIQSRFLFPLVFDFFDEYPDDTLEGRLLLTEPYPGATFKAWTLVSDSE